MFGKTLDCILTLEHRSFRLTLTEDEDFIYLKRGDQVLATFSARGATITGIHHKADQQVQWAKSGVTFVKVTYGPDIFAELEQAWSRCKTLACQVAKDDIEREDRMNTCRAYLETLLEKFV